MNKNHYTNEEAGKKFCPVMMRSCKGSDCMMMDIVDEVVGEVKDPKKPDNPPVEGVITLYSCRLKIVPTIRCGELEIPADYGEKE